MSEWLAVLVFCFAKDRHRLHLENVGLSGLLWVVTTAAACLEASDEVSRRLVVVDDLFFYEC